jgi:hypothetical protein
MGIHFGLKISFCHYSEKNLQNLAVGRWRIFLVDLLEGRFGFDSL